MRWRPLLGRSLGTFPGDHRAPSPSPCGPSGICLCHLYHIWPHTPPKVNCLFSQPLFARWRLSLSVVDVASLSLSCSGGVSKGCGACPGPLSPWESLQGPGSVRAFPPVDCPPYHVCPVTTHPLALILEFGEYVQTCEKAHEYG